MSYKDKTCLFSNCKNQVVGRQLCITHYRKAKKDNTLHQYKKYKTDFKGCKVLNCLKKHSGLGFCHYHFQKLPHVKKLQKNIAARKKSCPVRKKQKIEAQKNYSFSPKGSYSLLIRQVKKTKKQLLISLEEYAEIKSKPCYKCSGDLEPRGVCLTLIDKKKDYTLDNVRGTCKICQLIKPIEDFNPITHSKDLLRRHWKKTPMAMTAIQKARKGDKYECSDCSTLFPRGQIEVDHVIPAVDPVEGFIDLHSFVIRLFCNSDNLQVLCKPCHKTKTKKENEIRYKNGSIQKTKEILNKYKLIK